MEGDAFKISVALGGGACDGIRLLQGKTATFHIVYGGNCHRVAVLPHSDSLTGPSKQHAFIGGRFPYLVGAVGKGIVASACSTGFVGRDGHYHLAHSVSLAAHHHGVGAAVDNFKVNPCKAGVALGSGAGLTVLLGDSDTAPHHIVLGFVLQHLPIFINGDGDFLRKCQQHGVVGGGFTDSVIAIRESVCPGSCYAAGVGRNSSSHLPRLDGPPTHHNGILAFIHNFKRNPR